MQLAPQPAHPEIDRRWKTLDHGKPEAYDTKSTYDTPEMGENDAELQERSRTMLMESKICDFLMILYPRIIVGQLHANRFYSYSSKCRRNSTFSRHIVHGCGLSAIGRRCMNILVL